LYKVLLCWRYLRTRYLAMACIFSVMLGVATLIVVNSVMSGFSTKLRDRLHGLLSDVLIEATTLEGFTDPGGKMDRIRKDPYLADKIEAMTPTLEVFAMLQFRLANGETITRTVRLIGVDPEGRSAIGGFKEFLLRQKDAAKPSFAVAPEVQERYILRNHFAVPQQPQEWIPKDPDDLPPPTPPPSKIKIPKGIIVGNLIASFRYKDPKHEGVYQDLYLLNPGDAVVITTVSGQRLAPVYDTFLVVDYFKSEMSEYDSNCVFVPLDYLQHLRTMQDRVTSIQIKLKDYRDAEAVVKRLEKLFPSSTAYHIQTWEAKQSSLLQAIAIEKGILNVLLFLIVGVAGFGILAIFTMIVAEKTRDIGILKALGASNLGIMKIFLGYGLLLGLVGTAAGTGLGVWLTENINGVEEFLGGLTGQKIFNPEVYYFTEIPTDIQPLSLCYINIGAVLIAVVFSVLPALRAAMLHPVRALRYE
jgi:lipoprotein-releasing system permease protein